MKKRFLFLSFVPFLILSLGFTALGPSDLPKKKQTTLGLYVTAKEAYAKWNVNPDKIHILDVRTPEEYIFVGHAPMAFNIPILFVKYAWNAEKERPAMVMNASFVFEVKEKFKTTDTLFVMCRSGVRSAIATDLLAKAGFNNVHSVIDGFEGDKVNNPNSYFNGKRLVNGWKNSGSPWTYHLDPKLMYLP
jgi:rhodanese-related sulfurtransferase